MNKLKVTIDLDNLDCIVKLDCTRMDCTSNLAISGSGFYCNLKHITIDDKGRCSNFSEIKDEKNVD